MKIEKVKEMMDACYLAKRVRDMLPELPEGVAPSYIKFLDVIHNLEQKNGKVRISDISDALNLPRPGVTRTLKKMEEKGDVHGGLPHRRGGADGEVQSQVFFGACRKHPKHIRRGSGLHDCVHRETVPNYV